MDSYKLLILTILLNMVVAMSASAYNNFYTEEEQNSWTLNNINSVQQFYDDKALKDFPEAQTNYEYEKTAGNTVEMGDLLIDTFVEGITLWSIHPGQFKTTPEKAVAGIVLWLRIILMFAIALELLFILKNRKSS